MGKSSEDLRQMHWFRMHHGATTDNKLGIVSVRSKQPVAIVLAVWVCLLEDASQNKPRGIAESFNAEVRAFGLGLPTEVVSGVIDAMQGLLLEGLKVINWDKRQPKRERETPDDSLERVKKHRENKKSVTPSDGADLALHGVTGVSNAQSRALHGVTQACNATKPPCNALEESRVEESRGDKAAAATSSTPPEATAPPQPLQAAPAAPAASETDWFEVVRDALIAAKMPEGRAMNETGSGQEWAHKGYTPALVISAISELAKRPGYTAPRSLAYFKSAIADRHGIGTVKAADPIVKPAEPIDWIAKAKKMDREEWYYVLKAWKNREFNPDLWKADRYGPMPGQPGCLVHPEALLIVPVPNLQAA